MALNNQLFFFCRRLAYASHGSIWQHGIAYNIWWTEASSWEASSKGQIQIYSNNSAFFIIVKSLCLDRLSSLFLFQIVEFIAILLRTGSEAAQKELVSSGTIKRTLDLFFE